MQINREGAGENHLIIDFNEGSSNFRFEFRWMSLIRLIRCWGPGDSKIRSMMCHRFFLDYRNSNGNFQLVFSFGEVGKGKEPNHSGMDHRELLGPKV